MDKSQQAYSEWYRECAGQPNELRVIWDAAWQASRKQALEEAANAVDWERLTDFDDDGEYISGEDRCYDLALTHAAGAIRSLEGNAKETT